MTRYYTFTFDERHAGYYVIEETPDRIYENAIFWEGGERIENPFTLTLDEGRIVAYKAGDGDWQSMPDEPGLYPSCAYPLLVPHVEDELHFTALNESDGSRLPATLRREGNMIVETEGDRVTRRFWLDGDEIVKIDWGNDTISEMRPTLDEARGDSGV